MVAVIAVVIIRFPPGRAGDGPDDFQVAGLRARSMSLCSGPPVQEPAGNDSSRRSSFWRSTVATRSRPEIPGLPPTPGPGPPHAFYIPDENFQLLSGFFVIRRGRKFWFPLQPATRCPQGGNRPSVFLWRSSLSALVSM